MLSQKLQLTIRDRKVIAALLTLILLCSGISAFVGYNLAQGQTTNLTANTMTGGQNSGAPTYTVFPDGGYYYYKDHLGAISSPTANFTGIMTTVIDLLGSSDGGSIFLPKGTYTDTSGNIIYIWGKNNIKIYGEGADTAITQSAGLNVVHFFQITNSNNIEITNLRIDGNKASESGGTSAIAIGGTSANCKVDNCYINNMYNFGVQIYDSATYNWIINNQISGCTNNGISIGYTTATAGFNTVSQNNIYYVAFGVGLYLADHNTITDNQIQNNPAVAYNEGVNLDSSSFNTISGNHIIGTGDVGIAIHNQYALGYSWYNTVSDNMIKATKFHGIHLINYTSAGSIENNIITANQIVDCNVANGAYDGIKLENVRANTVTDNTVIDDRGGSALMKWGIEEVGSDYNILQGDRCVGCVTGGIWLQGSNSKANLCYNSSSWIP